MIFEHLFAQGFCCVKIHACRLLIEFSTLIVVVRLEVLLHFPHQVPLLFTELPLNCGDLAALVIGQVRNVHSAAARTIPAHHPRPITASWSIAAHHAGTVFVAWAVAAHHAGAVSATRTIATHRPRPLSAPR